jgi:hypothetical protein
MEETRIGERNVFGHLSKGKSKLFAMFQNRNYYEDIGTKYGISGTFVSYLFQKGD